MPNGNGNQDRNGTESSSSTDSASPENPIDSPDFNKHHFSKLAENEYARYLYNAKTVGHAVIRQNGDVLQFNIPFEVKPDDKVTPAVVPLKDITGIIREGQHWFSATTLDNKPMFARRFLDLEFQDQDHSEQMRIATFSPPPKKWTEPWWGANKPVPLLRDDLADDLRRDINRELREIPQKFKGGDELDIDPPSIPKRMEIRTRKPDQNTVMNKQSAINEFRDFLDSRRDELHPDLVQFLEKCVTALLQRDLAGVHDFKEIIKSHFRPEWLHGEGFTLTPMSKDPQRKNNLGAAPKWCNTEMMVVERIVQWFALHHPESHQKIKPLFEMLLNTEIIKNILFEATIEENGRKVVLKQTINPFHRSPQLRKASDLAQAVRIVDSLVNDIPPESIQQVQGDRSSPFFQHDTQGSNLMKPEATSSRKRKRDFPTDICYENSVVEVTTTINEKDYGEPWSGGKTVSCSGTGVIIQHADKNYILTNAHCVENAAMIRIRKANTRKGRSEARVKCVSYQSDLALLEIDDQTFFQDVQPAALGNMVSVKDKVYTVGFPMGGNELSITKGIVSRIEVQDYSESGEEMLQVQVDAAINHGNSGGPVYSKGKVVGIAFQGIDFAQNLGYMIPMPIVHRFLAEAFSNRPYRGFPVLPVHLHPLENPHLRKYYGLDEEQSGIRIGKINRLTDAFQKLKPNDILLEIDSLKVSNEGKVNIPGVGKCIDLKHIAHMKFIGDTVRLKVLRKDKAANVSRILDISVMLDTVPRDSNLVPAMEYDKMPDYFICSGVSFMPLTLNYLNDKGSELRDAYSVESNCRLIHADKQNPDDQPVIINDILDCEETYGYDSAIDQIVKCVNGKPINKFQDLIDAMDGYDGIYHEIEMKSGKMIIIKNMSRDEHEKLLQKYNILYDRSQNLFKEKASRISQRTEDNEKISGTSSSRKHRERPSVSRSSSDSSSSSEEEIQTRATSRKKARVIISESDSDNEVLTRDMLPGMRNFNRFTEDLEARELKRAKEQPDYFDDASHNSLDIEMSDVDSQSENNDHNILLGRKLLGGYKGTLFGDSEHVITHEMSLFSPMKIG